MAYKNYKRSGNNIGHTSGYNYPMVVPQPKRRHYYQPNFSTKSIGRKYRLYRGNFRSQERLGSFTTGGIITDKSSAVVKRVWHDDYIIIIFCFLLVVFFVSALNLSANPLDMFFGNGEDSGGILRIVSDFGTNTIDFMNSQINVFKEWGIVGNPDGFWNLIGSILTIITFLVNLLIQALILVVRLIMYLLTGGVVSL